MRHAAGDQVGEVDLQRLGQAPGAPRRSGSILPRSIWLSIERDTPESAASRSSVRCRALRSRWMIGPISGRFADAALVHLSVIRLQTFPGRERDHFARALPSGNPAIT